MKTLIKTALIAAAGASLVAVSAVPAYAGPKLPPNAPAPATPSTPVTPAAAPTSSNGVAAGVVGSTYHVFAVSTSGKLQQGIYTRGSKGWGWQTAIPTGVVTGTPGVVYTAATNRYDVFAVGGNGQLYQAIYSKGWSTWHSIGGANLVGGVNVVRDRDGYYHVFAVDTSGRLQAYSYFSGKWYVQAIGTDGQVRGTPGVSYDLAKDTYFVLDTGLNGALYYKDITNKVGNWTAAGGSNLHYGAAVVATSTQLQVFAVNTAGTLYVSAHAGQFTDLGGVVRGTPGAVVTSATRTDIFAVGSNGSMYQKIYAGGTNGAWGRIGGSNLA